MKAYTEQSKWTPTCHSRYKDLAQMELAFRTFGSCSTARCIMSRGGVPSDSAKVISKFHGIVTAPYLIPAVYFASAPGPLEDGLGGVFCLLDHRRFQYGIAEK